MTTLSYRAMAFGTELRGICHYLNIYAPVFQPDIVETRGADEYWQVETFTIGSMENEERVITESFEVHAQEKEWCVRIAAHIALGRIMETYAARLKGTVYAEMAKVLPSGNIIPKRFRYVPGAICQVRPATSSKAWRSTSIAWRSALSLTSTPLPSCSRRTPGSRGTTTS